MAPAEAWRKRRLILNNLHSDRFRYAKQLSIHDKYEVNREGVRGSQTLKLPTSGVTSLL